ncbi:MAG: phenylalanine 4-monooxygenase [Pseudomonadota bacterium]|nr:phenylalanine 4-monooxygenase [Pseudomonadota bacterium]MDE3037639.1 phenylalanine 4-monooxygenase [Pseudomonadota bacterium]
MRADTHPPDMRPDYTFDFDPRQYGRDDHAIWRFLCERQKPLLKDRACKEYLKALEDLSIVTEGGIPDFRRISDLLEKMTNWRLVVVPGLIPGRMFLEHLSRRRFPVTWWIRGREQTDYLKEPDVFHDLFGHVPLLSNPVFADYLQQFGLGAMKAAALRAGKYIERLYWFTVEFGLINTQEGLRIYGSGIVSSATESVYALESKKPNRIGFDLLRMMRTRYKYDDLQPTYFVIDSFEQLFEETRPDFTDYYAKIRDLPEIGEQETVPGDRMITGDAM